MAGEAGVPLWCLCVCRRIEIIYLYNICIYVCYGGRGRGALPVCVCVMMHRNYVFM